MGIILGKMICKCSNWQHIQRLKITILGANWQVFRLERIAKCSYFILSTQNIKLYWFVMKIKKFLLPIWWYNRGLFPLGNKYFDTTWYNYSIKGFRCWSGMETVHIFSSKWYKYASHLRLSFTWKQCKYRSFDFGNTIGHIHSLVCSSALPKQIASKP